MTQPPVPGPGQGAQPGRDPGLPGGAAGSPGSPGSRGPAGPRGSSPAGVPVLAPGGRDPRLAAFAKDDAGDRFPPNGWLAMVLDELSGPDRRCPGASDDELAGLLGRWAALESWAASARLGVVAELVRRRALPGHEPRSPGGLPSGWEPGTGHEVSGALAVSLPAADKLVELAVTLQGRLPGIGALLAAGIIDVLKARIVADELAVLDDAHAARAEEMLLGELAGKTPGQVGKLAAAAAAAVDPEGAVKRRERAERDDARVRFWRERAGTAALAACGLPTDAALAANANIKVRAVAYKKAKVSPGAGMDQLRVLAFLDILNGITAGARIAQAQAEAQARAEARAHAGQPAGTGTGTGSSGPGHGTSTSPDRPGGTGRPGSGSGTGREAGSGDPDSADQGNLDPDGADQGNLDPDDADQGETDDADRARSGDTGSGGTGPGGTGPGGTGPQPGDAGPALAASTNLTIPLATLLELADRPGEGHDLGPLDPALCRDLAAAAARSPHSTWCLTITGPDGTAIAHGCARPANGKHGEGKRGKGPPGTGAPGKNTDGKGKRGKGPPGKDTPGAGTPGKNTDGKGPPGIPPPAGSRDGPWAFTPRDDPGPPGGYGTWTLALPGGRDLTVKIGPIPVTGCDHRYETHAYQPGDLLRHLVQVRDGTCTFPACSRHARDCDFEHAVPYGQGGRTCACNAGARSRRCHKVKQSKGWTVTQPRPGWHQWTAPSGRTYVQGPKKYPA